MSLVGAILAIGLLIVVHEAGHYFVARWCRMRVDRFSIGFGPPILSWRRGETDFTLGPIPFGGFVQINGMTLSDEVEPDDPRAYPHRPAWQRFATIFAGPATNYLTAIAIAFLLYLFAGVPGSTARYTVGELSGGYDASGKLQVGDTILRVDDQPIYFLKDGEPQKGSRRLYSRSRGRRCDPRHSPRRQRAPSRRDAAARARRKSAPSRARRVTPGPISSELPSTTDAKRESAGVFGAAVMALKYPVVQTYTILDGLYQIVSGQQEGALTGPVGITTMIKRTFEIGIVPVLELLMLLNVYLGIFNLLPLPALDGGRLVFLGYEMATRRRANPRVEATVHMVGIMALLVIMVLVTYKDITRPPLTLRPEGQRDGARPRAALRGVPGLLPRESRPSRASI